MNPVLVILIVIGCIVLFVALMPLFSKIGDKVIKRWNDTFNEQEKDEEERKEK